jgi:hypothetical protein
MELNSEIAYHILHFHGQLMTDTERKAQGHLIALAWKAMVQRGDVPAEHEVDGRKFLRLLSDEPNVLALTRDGVEQFKLMTAARIFRDSPDKLLFNCCPQCGKLARTPTAKQCRHCKHDWHRTSLT